MRACLLACVHPCACVRAFFELRVRVGRPGGLRACGRARKLTSWYSKSGFRHKKHQRQNGTTQRIRCQKPEWFIEATNRWRRWGWGREKVRAEAGCRGNIRVIYRIPSRKGRFVRWFVWAKRTHSFWDFELHVRDDILQHRVPNYAQPYKLLPTL